MHDHDYPPARWHRAQTRKYSRRRRRFWMVGGLTVSLLFLYNWLSAPPSIPGGPGPIAGWVNNDAEDVKTLLALPTIFNLTRLPTLLESPPPNGDEVETTLRRLSDTGYRLSWFERPHCELSDWHRSRYESLRDSSGGSIFLALNLINAEVVMPTFLNELPKVLRFLSPRRIFVSILENGSTDRTPHFLRLLASAFDVLGTPYDIIVEGNSAVYDKSNGRRIEVLAKVRNLVLRRLYDGTAAKGMASPFQTMLFMNDVVHCAADVLEVLFQHLLQDASMTCSTDWGGAILYDRWVARSMSGSTFYRYTDMLKYFNEGWRWGYRGLLDKLLHPVPRILPNDSFDNARLSAHMPLQVFSCWNGMAAVRADAFSSPYGIRFRQARNAPPPTENGSECFLLPVDLWRAGMGRIAMVPKASVEYSVTGYERVRKDRLRDIGGWWPFRHYERIDWKREPPPRVAFQDKAIWWLPERWGPWDEE